MARGLEPGYLCLSMFVPPSPLHKPELFFALVGPLGTDLDAITAALRAELLIVGYQLREPIRLIKLAKALPRYERLGESPVPEDQRLCAHMDAGDEIRRSFGHGGALAALAVAEVKRLRTTEEPLPATAFLLRSLKHPAEVALLRELYGASLIVISVHEEHEKRVKWLAQKIEKSRRDPEGARRLAEVLIMRDQDGSTDKLGQSVRKTFPLGDFFLDAGGDLRRQIERLVHVLFSHPQTSPTRDEYAMFSAQAVALRSSDMSRQIGAAIVDADGEVLAVGCNEVPKPGGGVYWTGDKPDCRDFRQGSDPNAIMGREILLEVFRELKQAGWLGSEHAKLQPSVLVEEAREAKLLDRARISNLIEFGRVVHAEMNALVYAARRGIPVDGQKLYCTTFPCHVCARHLIGAGICSIVFIEPYPKSLALELYPEVVDPAADQRVSFRPFTGIAPRRYLEFFDFGRRKDARGYALCWDPGGAEPRVRSLGNPHLLAEKALCDKLQRTLAENLSVAKS